MNRNRMEQGYDKHAGHSVMMFRNKFWISLILTVPVIIYSPVIQNLLSFKPPIFLGSEYIQFIFSTIIFFYGGLIFIKGSLGEIKFRRIGMMTLISLAIITSYIYSIATQFFITGDSFYWELATLITIMLLGHWLEMASINRAENALDSIKKLLPEKAEKIVNGMSKQVLISELQIGDIVLIRPGANIPVDGVVIEGISSIDESAISGESILVTKKVNDNVIAGTINQEGSLNVKVTKLGNDTVLAGIVRLVSEAQHSKSNVQILADKAAFILTITAISAAILTFIIWLNLKGSGFAIERAVTVLVIACPHALGLAIPLVIAISTTMSARNGLLIRKRTALETARNINIVLFDKTGTLTEGRQGITDIWTTNGYSEDNILHLMASLEQNSEHAIGKAIINKTNERHIHLDKVENFVALPGTGIKGILHGKETYLVVNRNYLDENNINIPSVLSESISQNHKVGKTEVYLIFNNDIIGAVSLMDIIRPESKLAVTKLKQMGIKTAMITGDSKNVASYITKQLGIDQYFAEVKPSDKADKVMELQQQGLRVAMVGDGVNDAPALTQADIGIAIGAGTDIAIQSADIILIRNDPSDVLKVINLSKLTYKKMVQNLVWVSGYNLITIPLAAGVLFGYGIVLTPAIGAILMSVSTIIVALNAQLLRRKRLTT